MKTFLFIQKFLQISFISLVLTLVMIYLPLSIYVYNQAQKAGIDDLSTEYFDLYSQANHTIGYFYLLAIIPYIMISLFSYKRYSNRSLLYEQLRKKE